MKTLPLANLRRFDATLAELVVAQRAPSVPKGARVTTSEAKRR